MSDRWQCERCEAEFEWLTDFRAHTCEPRLTVADVLKLPGERFHLYGGDFELLWNEDRMLGCWQIWKGGGFHFESPDEHAACAAFLRLTTNPNE